MFQPKNLAHNIKKYRKLRGLTQNELADRLFVTAQNVSKWETGKSVPDLDNLCKLTNIFAVSPDRLLGYESSPAKERILAAIDGGGTKTEFVLYTESGQILKRLLLGGSNPNTVGIEATQALLQTGLDQLLSIEPNICAVYAGIAGCGLKDHQNKVLAFLKKTYPMMQCSVASDVPNVIYSAPVEDRCIAVICGTGSVVFAKTPDAMHRLGGWGWLWESGCSGYDFGRDALRAALAARENVGPQTCLLGLAEARLDGDVEEKIGDIYRLGQDGIAAFASLVFEAYAQGDAVAEQILEKNAAQLALLINAAAEQYDCGKDVVIAGGLIHYKEVLQAFLADKLIPGLHLIFNAKPQICGAAAGGCRMLGEPNPDFKENFYKNYLTVTEEMNHAENRDA